LWRRELVGLSLEGPSGLDGGSYRVVTMDGPRLLNIQPGVSVLSVLRYLNYEPWYALAEFVDNSLQSALDCQVALRKYDGAEYRLNVEIEYEGVDAGRLIVRDNAAGIHDADYDRAFKTAERPPNVGNLAEFGMGMKSASCWFGRTWSVRSKALGELEERTVTFDVDEIVDEGINELAVRSASASPAAHYTEVILTDLNRPLGPRTIGKVKDHLAAIYRSFLRSGFLTLSYNGEELHYSDPRVLKAAPYRDPSGAKRRWLKEFDLDLGDRRRVKGFAALRETANVTEAGFSIFRRGRLIQGGPGSGYRPEEIFRKANSYTYQRLFGELHVEGFGVSHTKDAIQWDGHEEGLIGRLSKELNRPPVNLLDQAEGYRVRPPRLDLHVTAEAVLDHVMGGRLVLATDMVRLAEPRIEIEPPERLETALRPFTRDMELALPSGPCRIRVEAVTDPAVGDWLAVSDRPADQVGKPREVTIRISLAHPFMVAFAGPSSEALEALVRIAVGIGLAEVSARDAGVRMASAIRTRLNDLLRGSLAQQS
jgi:hypothetical protein